MIGQFIAAICNRDSIVDKDKSVVLKVIRAIFCNPKLLQSTFDMSAMTKYGPV